MRIVWYDPMSNRILLGNSDPNNGFYYDDPQPKNNLTIRLNSNKLPEILIRIGRL